MSNPSFFLALGKVEVHTKVLRHPFPGHLLHRGFSQLAERHNIFIECAQNTSLGGTQKAFLSDAQFTLVGSFRWIVASALLGSPPE